MSMWGRKEPDLQNKDEVTLEAKKTDLQNKDEVTWADNIFETSNNPASLSYGYEKLVEIPTLKEGVGSRGVLKKLATLEFIKEATWNLENAKKVESFAEENGIAINFKEAIQKVFIEMVNNGRIDSILKLEQYAKDKNIVLEIPSQEIFQKAFNKQLTRSACDWSGTYGKCAKKIEEYAQQNGIKIELNDALQQAFNSSLVDWHDDNVQRIEGYAEEKGIKLSFDKIIEGRDNLLEKGFTHNIISLEEYAMAKGIALPKPSPELLQKTYENISSKGYYNWIDSIREFEHYASRQGVKLLEVPQEIFQRGFEKSLSRINYPDWQERAQETLLYANNINIDEVFQRAYKQIQSLGDVHGCKKIIQFAKNNGIEFCSDSGEAEIIEACYMGLLHNCKEGHAEGKRRNLTEQADAKGLKLDYKKCIKIDYLNYLNVPNNERLIKEQRVAVGRATVKATFYGHIKNNEDDGQYIIKNIFCLGKFILAENKSTNELELIFDSTLGEHVDIGAKYDVDVIGGGWMKINTDYKEIEIFGESQKFGYEPRLITVKVVSDCFPDYRCSVSQF